MFWGFLLVLNTRIKRHSRMVRVFLSVPTGALLFLYLVFVGGVGCVPDTYRVGSPVDRRLVERERVRRDEAAEDRVELQATVKDERIVIVANRHPMCGVIEEKVYERVERIKKDIRGKSRLTKLSLQYGIPGFILGGLYGLAASGKSESQEHRGGRRSGDGNR